MILSAAFRFEVLFELAAGGVGTSNRRHWSRPLARALRCRNLGQHCRWRECAVLLRDDRHNLSAVVVPIGTWRGQLSFIGCPGAGLPDFGASLRPSGRLSRESVLSA